jgi:hypothetical protein
MHAPRWITPIAAVLGVLLQLACCGSTSTAGSGTVHVINPIWHLKNWKDEGFWEDVKS